MILLVSATIAFLTGHDLSAWERMLQIIQQQLPWIQAAAKGDQATVSKADLVKLMAQSASVIATLVAVRKASRHSALILLCCSPRRPKNSG